ncbi:MAG: OmpA family protein [Vampirovibrionales bacterium]
MARKHKHPEHENLERWLVSYADFITLLFATFTALYAIAQSKLTVHHDVSKNISEGFQTNSILKGIASIMQGKSTPTDRPNPAFEETGRGEGVIGKYESLTYTEGEIKEMEKLSEELLRIAQQLEQELEELQGAGEGGETNGNTGGGNQVGANPEKPTNPIEAIGKALGLTSKEGNELTDAKVPVRGLEVSIQERGLKISFDSRLLFKPGSVELDSRTVKFLDAVAERLKQHLTHHLIYVEGHTDAGMIQNTRFPSNWELSAGRASVVVRRFIQKHQFLPMDLAAVGYADSRPLAPNTTPEGRSKNRRVDIILMNRQTEQTMDPLLARQREQAVRQRPSQSQAVMAKPQTGTASSTPSVATTNSSNPSKPTEPSDEFQPTFVKQGPNDYTPVQVGEVLSKKAARALTK